MGVVAANTSRDDRADPHRDCEDGGEEAEDLRNLRCHVVLERRVKERPENHFSSGEERRPI